MSPEDENIGERMSCSLMTLELREPCAMTPQDICVPAQHGAHPARRELETGGLRTLHMEQRAIGEGEACWGPSRRRITKERKYLSRA